MSITTPDNEIPTEAEGPDAFNIFQGIVLIAGATGNLIFFITMIQNKLKSFLTTLLLRIQFVTDSCVCIMAFIILFQSVGEPIDPDPNPLGNAIYCHTWLSQYVYWVFVFSSVQNLICISADRYWAVVEPRTYKLKQKFRAILCTIIVAIYSNLITFPTFFLVTYVNGTCLTLPYFQNKDFITFLKPYAVFWWSGVYLIPTCCFLFLNTKIIRVMIGVNSSVDSSVERKNVTVEFTRSTIVVTGVFIVTVVFDSSFYMISNLVPEMVQYEFGHPIQRVSLFLVSVNSCANPFIYFIFMRTFRSLILDKLPCCTEKRVNPAKLDECTVQESVT